MNVFEAVRARRSVKHFRTGETFPDEELRRLLEHVALTPSSFNMQNWHFVAVRDPKTREELCAAAWNQAQVKECPLVLVIAGDTRAHERFDRYLRKAPAKLREVFAPMITGFYTKEETILAEACRSAGLAAMTIMLLAKEMGYDSCPMIGFDPAKVSEILGLDEEHPPLLMITIGHAAEPARPRMGLLDLEELVSLDRFGNHDLKGEIPDD